MADTGMLQFETSSVAGQSLVNWWEELKNRQEQKSALKRCKTLTEVVFVPAYHHLFREMDCYNTVNQEGLALVAGLAAHVKQHDGRISLAEQMARQKVNGGSARVSGLRFRRLLKIRNGADLLPVMIRIVHLLGGTVNMISLAQSVYLWNEHTRRGWAFDYYSRNPFED